MTEPISLRQHALNLVLELEEEVSALRLTVQRLVETPMTGPSSGGSSSGSGGSSSSSDTEQPDFTQDSQLESNKQDEGEEKQSFSDLLYDDVDN